MAPSDVAYAVFVFVCLLAQLAPGFTLTALSTNGTVAAIEDASRAVYGVQFHPEVDLTQRGQVSQSVCLCTCAPKCLHVLYNCMATDISFWLGGCCRGLLGYLQEFSVRHRQVQGFLHYGQPKGFGCEAHSGHSRRQKGAG